MGRLLTLLRTKVSFLFFGGGLESGDSLVTEGGDVILFTVRG